MLAVIPGPRIFYVAARALTGGRAEGVASSFGTGLGGMAHVLAGTLGVRCAFREGVLVEALNPKTAAFFLAFVPQFVDPAAGGVREGLAGRPGLVRRLSHPPDGPW